VRRALFLGLLLATVGAGRVASAQTVNGAQCADGDVSAVGEACTTSDGGAGTCFSEMCSIVVDGGTSLGPCALCYAAGQEPPGDGGAIVVISTTTTTSTDDGGCRVASDRSGQPTTHGGGVLLAGALVTFLARKRRRTHTAQL
jgi:hypothetical protein